MSMRYLRQPKRRMVRIYEPVKRGKAGTTAHGQRELDLIIMDAVRSALAWMGKSHSDSTRSRRAKYESKARKHRALKEVSA